MINKKHRYWKMAEKGKEKEVWIEEKIKILDEKYKNASEEIDDLFQSTLNEFEHLLKSKGKEYSEKLKERK
ncbi:hypothetical protein [Fervidicoccus fontis]|nr:hypothetical protein [Fervidicoccus fontis]PMB78421.1 MAG: hypothetical protein C0177_00250 [Fervidicoccus fontis]